jgi:hypothetical protein
MRNSNFQRGGRRPGGAQATLAILSLSHVGIPTIETNHSIYYSHFFNLRESQLLKQMTPLEYGCISYFFEQSKYNFL